MDFTVIREKKENPCRHANWLSRLTFWWTVPIFRNGYRRDLDESDLFETLSEHRSSVVYDKVSRAWSEEQAHAVQESRQPSLLAVLFSVFRRSVLLCALLMTILECVFKMVQPVAIGGLVKLYSSGTDVQRSEAAYAYATVFLAFYFAMVLIFHPYLMAHYHLTLKVKVACCSLIYGKALRLSQAALGRTTVGHVVNLLSNDVSRIMNGFLFCMDVWLGPLATLIVTALMYQEIGPSALVGTCYLLCFVPLQAWIGNKDSSVRFKAAQQTDERLKTMGEVLRAAHVIKMYAWERPFAALVDATRREEIKYIRCSSYLQGVIFACSTFLTRTAVFASLVSYVLLERSVTAQQVFVVTAYFNVLKIVMTEFFPRSIQLIAQSLVSARRVQAFLLLDETVAGGAEQLVPPPGQKFEDGLKAGVEQPWHSWQLPNAPTERKADVQVSGVSARWDDGDGGDGGDYAGGGPDALDDVSVRVRSGELVMVAGAVGSGKSSLLQLVLGELRPRRGTVTVQGSVSYASQDPWLFAGTVRDNILFGRAYDAAHYRRVVRCCALEQDLAAMPRGDRTAVGERGAALSGGQRARVSLARAVYHQADVYLLDDPLGAVDAHVARQLFQDCVRTHLRHKAVVLVTHQLQYLRHADRVLVLRDGRALMHGTYDQVCASPPDLVRLLGDAAPEPSSPLAADGSIRDIPDRKCQEVLPDEEEQRGSGGVASSVYWLYVRAAGGPCCLLLVLALFVATQGFGSLSDYFVGYWVDLEERKARPDLPDGAANDTADGSGWWQWRRHLQHTSTCLYVYGVLNALLIVASLVRSFAFYDAVMRASVALHDGMFRSVCRAAMSFFNGNPAGRVLNRFSKDMGTVDDLLPFILYDCLQIGFSVVGVVSIVTALNLWLAAPLLALAAACHCLRLVYLATSRSVKRLEATTCSPVYAHTVSSLQGLATIRASGARRLLTHEFHALQDVHSSAQYLFMGTSRFFSLWLDVGCAVYTALVTYSFFLFPDSGGNVGLAITQLMTMTGFIQWGLRQLSELENNMVSVERIDEYAQLQCERRTGGGGDGGGDGGASGGDGCRDGGDTGDAWPAAGGIQFQGVRLAYGPDRPDVLHGVTFCIEPREKIGIVGRTGAGKSSLIQALFQLVDTRGTILIDGRDICRMDLQRFRPKISIIPQDPVLFSGSLRYNLDPFGEYDDATLWRALQDVQLGQAVAVLSRGLETHMSEGGANFSVGQRQLVCLARAVVRNNRILVLDEATANVDPHTDALIQTTIRTKFTECTVLTIAHRLHTVMDSDRVLVMDSGSVAEFDAPHILLQNTQGILHKMVLQTGPAMSDNLIQMAKESAQRKQD